MLSGETLAHGAVWAVIASNLGWAIASMLLLASRSTAPSTDGVAFVIAQAVAVVMFAELRFLSLRRSAVAA